MAESIVALVSAAILWVSVEIRRRAKQREPLSVSACKRCFFLRYFIEKEFSDEKSEIYNKHGKQENRQNRKWRIFGWRSKRN